MAKASSETIYLVSSVGTGYFYTYKKNRRRGKIKVNKYDPIAGKHVLFEEKKLSRLKTKFQREKPAAR